jgi:hypothetical protein
MNESAINVLDENNLEFYKMNPIMTSRHDRATN